MKKSILLLAIFFISIGSFNSCTEYKSLSNATSIAQLGGNPFLQTVAKTVIKEMGNMLIQNGMKNVASKIGLNTNLASILTTPAAVGGFKNMLTGAFKLPTNLVDQKLSSLVNIKDVVNLASNSGIFNTIMR
jgi:formate hydrogenlyase subunit 4